jgi:hemerythrin superfamily protein
VPDVVDLLLAQHARIEELFLLVASLDGDLKREAFDEPVGLLGRHEAAEEEIVHPLSRERIDGGDALIDDRLAEERQAKEMLGQLVEAGVDDPGFDTAILVLREAVLTHARYEERYEFPHLRAKVPTDRLESLAGAVLAVERFARPDPDRVREAARKA